jgi:long-subunit acyl-CoA synthetase (AMP-forming)
MLTSFQVFPTENDIAILLHTSGTTTKPKLVSLTHQNLLVSIQNISNAYNLTQVWNNIINN